MALFCNVIVICLGLTRGVARLLSGYVNDNPRGYDMRSNLANLVDDAFYAGSATASDGKWLAVSFRAMGKPGLGVAVSHHGCHMFDVWISNVGHYHAH